MTSFVSRDTEIHLGVDRIFTSPTARALYDNPIAIAEGAAGAPRIALAAHERAIRPLVLIQSQQPVSAAVVEFSSGVDSSLYDVFVLEIIDAIPETNNVSLYMRWSVDAGANFISAASSYRWATSGQDTAGTTAAGNSNTATEIRLSGAVGIVAAANYQGFSGTVEMTGFVRTTKEKAARWHATYSCNPNGDGVALTGAGLSNNATLRGADVDAMQLFMSSGNIGSGTFNLYGRAK